MPTVLISGAGRGLGLEFTKQYLDAGWTVAATVREPAKAEALRELQSKVGDKLSIDRLDVVALDQIKALAAKWSGKPIDALIMNAGIYGQRNAPPGEIDDADFLEVMRVNILAPLRCAAWLAPSVALSDNGKMAFVSSRMGSIGLNDVGGSHTYRASKAGLNAAIKSLSIEWGPKGATSFVMHPGWVRTDMGGSGADIDATTSVSGMIKVIGAATKASNGKFYNYTGEEFPW